ncbi:MAG: class III poly(R)-hydroxyalkanoic acid synthase subunit PhaC [Pseudomonadota bacterium]
MNPFDIVGEINEYNAKMAQGLKTLSELDDIEVGVSEKEPVYREDNLVLYHFKPRTKQKNKVPLLVVYALVNRPYMADLQEGRSMIQGLLDEGLDVYLIDWGYPQSVDKFLTLDDYINGYIDRCVDVVREASSQEKINVLGICQGGCFSLCYTALHQDKVRNLVTTVTPVDFHTKDDLLSHMVRKIDIDQVVDTIGNIPGEMLNWTFLTLKPYSLMGQKYVDLVDILDDKNKALNFMRMEKWIFDSPDQAGEAYREFIKQFYQDNGLVKASVNIGGQTVDLQSIKNPVLNIYAKDDHLVPPDSSKALEGCVGTKDYESLEFPGGHIGIYVSGKAQKMIPPSVGNWLAARS